MLVVGFSHRLELLYGGHREYHEVGAARLGSVHAVVIKDFKVVGHFVARLQAEFGHVEGVVEIGLFGTRAFERARHEFALLFAGLFEAVVEGEVRQAVIVGGITCKKQQFDVGAVLIFFGFDGRIKVGNDGDDVIDGVSLREQLIGNKHLVAFVLHGPALVGEQVV